MNYLIGGALRGGLAKCGLAAKVDARHNYETSTAAYRVCV